MAISGMIVRQAVQSTMRMSVSSDPDSKEKCDGISRLAWHSSMIWSRMQLPALRITRSFRSISSMRMFCRS